MVLLHRLSQFWQVVPESHNDLVTSFWQNEERNNRYIARFVGISGIILMSGFVFVDLMRGLQDLLPITVISLVLLGIYIVLALNQQRPISYIPIYPLYTVTIISSMIGTSLVAFVLEEMLQLIVGFFLVCIALLLVPSLTRWFLAALAMLPIAHTLATRVIIPETSQMANAQIYVIFLLSPVILALISRVMVKQRWDVFLKQYLIQEFNNQLQAQKLALQEANDLLEKRNEELDAFAHTVAHDLKNPLMVVVGYAEVARDEMLEDEEERWLEYLNHVISAGRRGNMIIQELLLLAAVRKEDIELEELDMGVIVELALERLSHHIEGNEVQVVQQHEWPVVMGYAGWVEEVWVNYISNAIKYGGRPCYIELTAEIRPDGWVRFGVRDNGPGLSAEARALLFREFTRLDKAKAKGHGLGLSVVRRIMEKLNGRVGIESTVGEGSTFYFELPPLHLK